MSGASSRKGPGKSWPVMVEERGIVRMRALAQEWGVKQWATLPRGRLETAIVHAYQREVQAEQRRAALARYGVAGVA
jgi:hypothetical protein